MSNDKPQPPPPPQNEKTKQPAKTPAPAAKTPPAKPVRPKVPPLFRGIDWFVLVLVFGVIWAVYLYTLAPELTLEDSGELCTASYYAGVPHPPGYPFWSIYSWLWTKIIPLGNVAWRVEVGESFALALACGLVGFMVSRGSSMLMEGIDDLKGMTGRWENAICIVCGIVSGLLLGFDAFVWNEAVVINRISIFDVPWLMLVALCLMRWIYAPHQRRYLYVAMFFFGLCFTIHQTMLVAAMGIEVCIAMANPRLGRDLFLGNSVIFGLGLIGMSTGAVSALNTMDPMFRAIFYVVGFGSIGACVWLTMQTKQLGNESLAVLFMGLLWVAGAAFYLYEPISCMTDPPMQWAYPRTVQGFFHALSRGQYEQAHPTDIIHDPGRFIMQLGLLVNGLGSSFSWIYIFVALVPFFFLWKMKNRERSWIIGLTAIYFCIGVLLTILMNTNPDRQDAEENKVFFAASHAVVAIFIGYGLALMTAYMATHYRNFRVAGLTLGAIGFLPALVVLYDGVDDTFFGNVGSLTYPKSLFLFLTMCAAFVLAALAVHWFINRRKDSPDDDFLVWMFGGGSLLFLGISMYLAFFGEDRLGLSQVFESLPRIFSPHQYSLPVWGALLIFGTVVIFIASLFFYRNRAPVLIALCLFAIAPVYSAVSHWAKSEQRNHWFGYWFGHDMFTPPFGIYPEMAPHAILFGGTDPGRFCPTYMIFAESFTPHKDQPYLDQKFDRRDVYIITQNALADNTYLEYLRAQYNRSTQQDPPFFSWLFEYCMAVVTGNKNVVTDSSSPDMGKGYTGVALIDNTADFIYRHIDQPLAALGASVEKRRRAEGVYPPKEIYIPTDADSQECFREYAQESQPDANGHVEVSGTGPVMEINGLLCKVIFDHNPTNEFYVEESFPLDWMYPYETPYGIIMKINRQPQPQLTENVFEKDHAFWTNYSERLIGNWITYDTPVQQIADFAQRVYLNHNYKGFTGDPRFIRDEDAQKAFSKLRSSQAGMYAWRCFPQGPNYPNGCLPEYLEKTPQLQDALIRETDFAFKQSFAFCPYSPEAVYRYVNFLLPLGRVDDALIVAETCQKFDPYNGAVTNLVDTLERIKAESGSHVESSASLQQMETEAQQNPSNVANLMSLGAIYMQMQQTTRATEIFDEAITNPNITFSDAADIAQVYAQMGNLPKVEIALEKLAAINPSAPEPRYDLARLKATLGQNAVALEDLKAALDLSAQRLKTNPAARNLLDAARTDPSFNALRSLPEFQKMVPPN